MDTSTCRVLFRLHRESGKCQAALSNMLACLTLLGFMTRETGSEIERPQRSKHIPGTILPCCQILCPPSVVRLEAGVEGILCMVGLR